MQVSFDLEGAVLPQQFNLGFLTIKNAHMWRLSEVVWEGTEKSVPAVDAYCRALNMDDNELFFEDYEQAFGKHYGPASDDVEIVPKGEKWDFEDESQMKKRYPKLFRKFCSE